MEKTPLIEISICAVILLSLSPLNTAAGYQTVHPSPVFDLPPWPTEGLVGVNYTFCFQIPEDPEADQFMIIWDWADGSSSGWVGPYASGEVTCASHAWQTSGQYLLKITLRDSEGNEGEEFTWMITIHEITTCEITSAAVYFGRVWFVIKNTGNADAVRLNWSIEIEVIISPPSIPWFWNGTSPDLAVGFSERISTNRFLISLGFRMITITITAFNVETVIKTTKGLFLGPLIILTHSTSTI